MTIGTVMGTIIMATIIMAMNITVTTMISGICRGGKGARQICDLRHQIDVAPCPRVQIRPVLPFRAWARRCVRPMAMADFAVPAFAHPTPLLRFARRLPSGSFR